VDEFIDMMYNSNTVDHQLEERNIRRMSYSVAESPFDEENPIDNSKVKFVEDALQMNDIDTETKQGRSISDQTFPFFDEKV
jgi:hypothetical protein